MNRAIRDSSASGSEEEDEEEEESGLEVPFPMIGCGSGGIGTDVCLSAIGEHGGIRNIEICGAREVHYDDLTLPRLVGQLQFCSTFKETGRDI